MDPRKRNPGAEAGAPKVIAFGSAYITGASYSPLASFATTKPLEPAWMPHGGTLQFAVSLITRNWTVLLTGRESHWRIERFGKA